MSKIIMKIKTKPLALVDTSVDENQRFFIHLYLQTYTDERRLNK